MSCSTKSFVLSTEEDTENLAQQFSYLLRSGDCVLLSGDIGSGKSFFSRSLIQHRFGQLIEVPSPTFTIVQTYDHPEGDIWHCDLYRLGSIEEIVELGMQAAFETAICLVEWPDRLGALEPANPIRLNLTAETEHHFANVSGPSDFIAQLNKN